MHHFVPIHRSLPIRAGIWDGWGAMCEWGTLLLANRKGEWALWDLKGHRMSRYYPVVLSQYEGSCFWAVYDGNDKIAAYLDGRGREIYSWRIDKTKFSEEYPMLPRDCSCGELIYEYTR